MKSLTLRARAKINITLDITGRRENGYHDVEMIMQTVDLHDRIVLEVRKEDKVTMETNVVFLPTDQRNLVVQIIEFMKKTYHIKEGIHVKLHKMIPIAAGLAGGSSDAAQTIIGMNMLFGLRLSYEEMCEIGERFGADIAYCIEGGTSLATGLGEIITPLHDFPEMYVLIVKPKFGVSTKEVYKNFSFENIGERPETNKMIDAIEKKDRETIYKGLSNVLETVTIRLHPSIQKIKDELDVLGANATLMSGSGPSVYGLFENKDACNRANQEIRKKNNIQFAFATKISNKRNIL